jgi:parvulin-like peptidyl-prolyl isomerase
MGKTVEDFRQTLLDSPDFEAQLTVEKLVVYSVLCEKKVLLQHILCATRQQAQQLRQKILRGADMALLAAKHSLDALSATNGGRLQPFPLGLSRYGLAFDKQVFKLREGELSPVLESKQGYHLVKVIKFIPGEKGSYQELKDRVWEVLTKSPPSENIIRRWIRRLRDQHQQEIKILLPSGNARIPTKTEKTPRPHQSNHPNTTTR